MNDDRCPFYYWDGDWKCLKRADSCTSYLFDTYCSDIRRCAQCPYFND